jgi:hypothetical protein
MLLISSFRVDELDTPLFSFRLSSSVLLDQLLERHQNHLNHQQQALTCQICLDLMHKPYALGPCGHVTCYDCLIRWFTAIQNFNEPQPPENGNQVDLEGGAADDDSVTRILDSTSARRGTFLRRRKTCPICRTAVYERPAEMWGIKNMVSALVRSHLVDLPEPPNSPTVRGAGERNQNAENEGHDPWRNVFRANRRRQQRNGLHLLDLVGHAPPHEQEEDRERFGWHDAEDGGIYRCVDCYHEIWDGVCSGCERVYQGLGDDHEEEEERNWLFPPQLLWGQNGDDDEDEDEDEDGDVYSDENQEDLGLDFGPGGWLVGTPEEEDDDDEDEEGYGTLNEYFDALEEMNDYSRLWSEGRRNLVSDPSDLEDEDEDEEKSGDEEGIISSEADEGLRRYEETYITSDSEAVESVRDGMARITRSQTRRRPVEVQSDSLSEGGVIENELFDGPGYFLRSRVRPVEVQSDSLSEGDVRENCYHEYRYHYDGPGHFTRSCRRHLSDSDSEADY